MAMFTLDRVSQWKDSTS